jgi:nitrate reductase gamma subunit
MMYMLVTGPLLWLTFLLFVGGLAYRLVRLIRLTEKRAVMVCQVAPRNDDPPRPAISAEERKLERIARFQTSVLGQHPVMTCVSTIFHLCLLVVPLFLMGHNVMLRNGLGIRLPSLPDRLADLLTLVVLGGAVFFLVRRAAVPKVAAISSATDYAVLLITVLPYLTGFLARHQVLAYPSLLTAHILTGELMLVAIPFTKVGHMVFFVFGRLALAGEFCLGRGNRVWAMGTRRAEPGRPA